ncbi:MAG: tetratricopeptide repeat protein [Caldilineales bacterium]|nr:tetratricopeptide repeat protein [Caldilineales bacterium]MDW8317551.1 tetratricopeptide repeat protein [Anaerolineae bacterium]
MDEPLITLPELLNQAAAALSLGDRAEAERLYRRATERSPGNTQAWLGLAAAVDSLEVKRACFERVLAINPANGEARAALERLAAAGSPEEARAIQATLAEAKARSAALPPEPPPAAAQPQGDGASGAAPSAAAGQALVCVNHPDTETTLRCNRCGRPMCVRCVELTEVGYRCKECIRAQQSVFFTADVRDYVVVALVSFGLALIATPVIELLLGLLGLFFGIILAIFLGPAVGGSAATVIRRSVGRRRGRYMGAVAVVAILLGVALGVLAALSFGLRINLIPLAVFVFTALSTIYATLR